MKDSRLHDWLRYRFDNMMARGTRPMIAGMGILFVTMVTVISFVVWRYGIGPDYVPEDFLMVVWMHALRTLDPSTKGESGTAYSLALLGVTLTRLFILTTLIAIINAWIVTRLNQLRKGRSRVVEHGHTVILGWSEQVFTIVSELAAAHDGISAHCVVVLADRDKVEMEDALADRVEHPGKTRIVCRQGNPMISADLDIASINSANAIVIVSPGGDCSDSDVIKTLLAIVNNPARRTEPYSIVAEIRDPANLPVATMVGGSEARIVMVSDFISRIIAQTCRQSGLSVIYTELLDFDGDEIYFHPEPGLAGMKFGDALMEFNDSAVIGIARPGETPRLNPPMDTVLADSDSLICIHSDAESIARSGRRNAVIDESAICSAPQPAARPERTLLLGWNRHASRIILELDQYAPAGSSLDLVADRADCEAVLQAETQGLVCNQEVRIHRAKPVDRAVLERLTPNGYDHVIVLCDDDVPDRIADSNALITLLNLRDIGSRLGRPFRIVSQLKDIRTRDLARVSDVDDFIVSDKLVSLVMSQLSENAELSEVFRDLFDADGAEIYVKPVDQYVKTGVPMSFHTVVESARRKGHVAIGYKIDALAADAARAHGVVVNPKKSETVQFSPGDAIIVLADD